ncbi:hypothetical protein [Erwinia sp. ErVv1]|uniref:hypothetical protein n=1 Tax=Erwinia sp. ErVv1 TaxID=1603299 RepID=UPI00082A2F7B|nr:hypothetical protein [Erwinia sp. ErVv1]
MVTPALPSSGNSITPDIHDALPEHPHASPSSTHSDASQTHAATQRGVYHIQGTEYHSANEAAIHYKLAALFENHTDGDNQADFHQLIEDRTRQLHAMNETPESIEAVLTKGSRLDRVAQVSRGAVRAIPFAVASVAFDRIPQLSAFAHGAAQLGMHAGLQSGIADTFGCALLDKATADTQWLAAEHNELEPVMQQAAEAKQPTTGRLAAEYAAAIQAYSVRNVVRLGTAAAVTATAGAKTAAAVDSWLTAGGGLAAGGAMSAVTHAVNSKYSREGAEYLFGRMDWKQRYSALKNSHGLTAPLQGAGKRLAKFPVDVATESLSAGREVLTASGMTKNALLAGGFAATLSARTAVSQAMSSKGFNAASTAAMNHLTNLALSMPVFASVPAAEILAPLAAERASKALQKALPKAVDWGARQIEARLTSRLSDTSGS